MDSREETAATAAAHPLPRLIKLGSTEYPSKYPRRISSDYIKEWKTFSADVREIVLSLPLAEILVPRLDMDETFMVGAELGLTGRFDQQVAVSVSNIMSKLPSDHTLSQWRFGDAQAVNDDFVEGNQRNSSVPDVILVCVENQDGDTKAVLRAVGELKTYWSCDLNECRVDGTVSDKRKLGSWLG